MYIEDVLSDAPATDFVQVRKIFSSKDGGEIKTPAKGERKNLGKMNVIGYYYCKECNGNVRFTSKGELSCVFISDRLISIDCVLVCRCSSGIPVWYLVESLGDITGQAPEIRVLERKEKFTEKVWLVRSDEYNELLDKSERAFRDGLGAGSMVYLRIILERTVRQIAKVEEIDETGIDSNGNKANKSFTQLLIDVDSKCKIVPPEYSGNNRQKLYGLLSGSAHGHLDEKSSLEKFVPLKKLVVGILDNIKKQSEYLSAITELGWAINERGEADA